MSGVTVIPFSFNIASASGVIGPFAASQTSFALIDEAFS